MSQILIVDDDIASCRMLQYHFDSQNHQIQIAHSVNEALEKSGQVMPEIIILDIRMPGKSGLEGLPDFKQVCPNARIIMITAFHDMDSTIQAMQNGADDYIHKPIDIDELDDSVAKVLSSSHSDEDILINPSFGSGINTMVGRSRDMKEIFKTIGRVAPSPATVLITGESGTGKELVAQAIHHASTHKNGPFVAINCAALVETLLESDMFGHERGAFTGATHRQTGKFTMANDGTIFLDEIGELSLTMQAKLLRVLQEKEFIPLGSKSAQKTNARIIAATNINLEKSVKAGHFREDLFYRLQVVNIHIPPLRERKVDIPDLIQTLLSRINKDMRRSINRVSIEVIDCLQQYEWPGNVRELENVLMKAVALCSHDFITCDLLPQIIHNQNQQSVRPTEKPDHEMSLQDMEKQHVKQVLEFTQWHRGHACDILGVSRPRLRRFIRQYELTPPAGVAAEIDSGDDITTDKD